MLVYNIYIKKRAGHDGAVVSALRFVMLGPRVRIPGLRRCATLAHTATQDCKSPSELLRECDGAVALQHRRGEVGLPGMAQRWEYVGETRLCHEGAWPGTA